MCYTGKCKYESSGSTAYGAGECTLGLLVPFGKEGSKYPDDALCMMEFQEKWDRYVEENKDTKLPDSQESGD